MKQNLAVYMQDSDYGGRLTGYLMLYQKFPFQVVTFTKSEILAQYAQKERIDVLLVGQSVLTKDIAELPVRRILVLTEERDAELCVGTERELKTVYKYQSMEAIAGAVTECYEAFLPPDQEGTPEQYLADYVGVYSPVRRCGKTLFSLVYAQLLSKSKRVLYLSLEYYAGMEQLYAGETGADLADALYYMQQGTLTERLGELTGHWGTLDVISPMQYPEELSGITPQSVLELIRQLRKSGRYDVVVFDAADCLYSPLLLLEECSCVYMPVKTDVVSKERLEAFCRALQQAGRERLLERIVQIALPKAVYAVSKDGFLEQLLCGSLGDFVRELQQGAAYG